MMKCCYVPLCRCFGGHKLTSDEDLHLKWSVVIKQMDRKTNPSPPQKKKQRQYRILVKKTSWAMHNFPSMTTEPLNHDQVSIATLSVKIYRQCSKKLGTKNMNFHI